MQNHTVVFKTASGDLSVSACEFSNLMEIALSADITLDAPCGGVGTCGKCRVLLLEGALGVAETGAHSHVLNAEEETAGWHLACKSTVVGDVTVEVPDSALAWQRGLKVDDSVEADDPLWTELETALRTEGLLREISTLSDEMQVFALTLTLEPPTIDDTTPDAERLSEAIARTVGVESVSIPLSVLQTLPELLRSENYAVRCLLQRERRDEDGDVLRVIALYPADSTAVPLALACDIGTTGVSLQLVDPNTGQVLAQASAGNVQISYGADVINRIVQQSKPGGIARLQRAVVEQTLNPLIAAVCEAAAVDAGCIVHMVIAGNTTMGHLFLGVQANPLRREPYVPCFGSIDGIKAGDIGLALPSSTPLYLSPNVGSYVGGDITAGILASGLWRREELQLFVDLGTNGELVFGNNEFMMTCACSAGPAFEGGGIRSGMRATNGAIEAATIEADFEPKLGVIGGGRPQGICGSGLIDVVSELFRTGALDGRGRFVATGKRFTCDEHGVGSYTLVFAEEACDGKAIRLDEVDLDNFIRAKGAIFSAIRVMLEATGFAPIDIAQVYIAGGIGSGIDIENAVHIGLFPDINRSCYRYLGNTSLTGARAMALDANVRTKVTELAHNMTYLELSAEPTYMDAFIAACFLPHTDGTLFPSVRK